jgi:hypothetical protein
MISDGNTFRLERAASASSEVPALKDRIYLDNSLGER